MKKIIGCFIVLILLTMGCSKNTLITPDSNTKSLGKVSINIDKANAPANVAEVVAILANANSDTLTGTMNLSTDTTADISFQNVNIGTWDLTVLAEDINGTVLYKGEANVIVNQGATTDVSLTLIPVQNNTGNISISVTWGSINLGNAMYLDGTSGYIEVPNSASLSSIDTAITIEAWVKPAQQYYNTIVCKGLSNYGIEFAQGLYPGIFLTGVTAQANYYWGRIMVPKFITENQWTHIAVTYSSSSGIKLYFNNDLVYSTPANGLIQPGSPPLRIGARVDSIYTEYFKGGLDDIRIWRIVRSQNEISKNMTRELTGNEYGLVAYWKFDELQNSDTIIHDSTPNHNDGKIHGGVVLATYSGN